MQVRKWLLSVAIAFVVACVGIVAIGADGAQAALVFHSGFETGDLGEFSSTTGVVSVVESPVKTGDYALRSNPTDEVGFVLANANCLRLSFQLRIAVAPDDVTAIAGRGSTNQFANIRLDSDRTLSVYAGLNLKGTGSTPLSTGQYQRISASIYQDGNFYCNLWIDDQIELSEVLLGENHIYFGALAASNPEFGIFTTNRTADLYFDDIVIDDVMSSEDIGDIRVLKSQPDADGTNTDFNTRLPTNGRPYFGLVNECPADDGNYIAHENDDATIVEETLDLEESSTLGLSGSDTINAVSVWVRQKRGSGKASTHQLVVYDTQNYKYTVANGTEFSWASGYFATKPSGGAWTQDAFDAFEAGWGRLDDGKQDTYFSCVMAMVAYTPSVGEADISNAPSGKAFGTVKMSTSYWSNGSAPTWPLDDGECYFTVTNSGDTCSITIKATDFTGGVGWTLAGSPGTDIVTLKAAPSGTDLAVNMTTLTTSEQSFISGLGTNSTKKWEMSMETPTLYGDAVLKESTVTLTATLD